MLHRTEAIVLKTMPFSEADLIVTSLTSDYGMLKTFAKSPRKIKSRFGSSLEPLTHSRISFWGKEDANLPRLTQSDIIRPFQPIRERLEHYLKVMEIVELTLSLLPEREANRGIFNLFLQVLDRIERDCLCNTITPLNFIIYKIRFLEIAGYGPRLDGCARCNKSGNRSGYNFYISHGSILCEYCAKNMDTYIRLSPGVVRLYEALKGWELPKIDRIKPSRTLISELTDFLDNHTEYTIARPLKTKSAL